MAKRKEKKHYVNNEDFYKALKEYKEKCNEVEKEWYAKYGEEKEKLLAEGVKEKKIFDYLPPIEYPRVPEYIGECVFLIADKLSNSPNFRSYSFKEDMVADGYEDCILRIRSFDPEKSTNPFAYFTQTCYFAAVRRIKKEKKQKTVKSEMVKNSGIIDDMENSTIPGDNTPYENSYLTFLKENVDQEGAAGKKEDKVKVKKTTKAYQKKLAEENAVEEPITTIDSEPEIINNVPDSIKEYYNDIEEE